MLSLFKIQNKEIKTFINTHFILSKALILIILIFSSYIMDTNISDTLQYYDAEHYIDIALTGYTENYLYAFFPLFPLILKVIISLGISPILGGVIINVLFSYLSTILISKISTDIYKNDDNLNKNILLIWFYSPISLFITILYTESIFILLSLAIFYYYKSKKNYILCGILLGLSVCSRSLASITFFVLFFFFVIEIIKYKDNRKTNFINLLKMYIPATIISCLYPLYLYIKTGNWKYFADVQFSHWSRVPSTPLSMFKEDIYLILNGEIGTQFTGILNMFLLVIVLFALSLMCFNVLKNKEFYKLDLLLIILFIILASTISMRYDGNAPASCSLYRYIYSAFPLYLLGNKDTLFKGIKIVFMISLFISTFSYGFNIFLC